MSHRTLLFVDTEVEASRFAQLLERHFDVISASTLKASRASLQQRPAAIVVAELALADGSALDLCRELKRPPSGPLIILTTADVQRAPDAIQAGCDAVLLKPYSPNLLFNRIGRLLQTETNVYWPDARCIRCARAGITSFEYSSHRRAWYACLECRHVWLARRLEQP